MPAVVEARPDDNITDVLVHRVRTSPDAPLFALPDGSGGWSDVSAAEFHRQVVALAKGLVVAGIEPGERIGMMCRTRYEWTLVDFAVFFAGAVLVPVYETSSPGQVHWNMQDSGAVAMILETADHFSRFDEVHPELPAVRHVWQIDLGDLDKLAEQGVDVPDAEIERRRNIAVGSDMATLIYTSGTTGGRRAASSRTRTSSSSRGTPRSRWRRSCGSERRRCSSSRRRTCSRASSRSSTCRPA
ncbi:Long-chain-fatty-acid--CoA ligase FadD15 [Clavibacter michiganensis subsp. michiganensis]|uniref:Long-chain-fatty-acid--CoA ligase FadD15 n=1 Tax=Clavibacter michiganensis subsp. michiganensis TaxID=33013 RepID=A0A251XI63_CLAMM|nr:Long-chain-fatty-acid--CoA ligase FadD15 [Clavibacter michiganensis subsp. michiganensis]OUE02583.1 Long-chain-fatty-acid--CoA ligase FadD15 [Clavibacter michiganensis subsp. michiganensis]